MKMLDIKNQVVLHGRRDNVCWFAPSATTVPSGDKDGDEIFVVVTYMLSTDFGPVLVTRSKDFGKSWRPPMLSQAFHKIEHENAVFESFRPGLYYHKKTGQVFGVGITLFTRDQCPTPFVKGEEIVWGMNKHRVSGYCFWDPEWSDFRPWKKFKLTREMVEQGPPRLGCSTQIHELPDGRILFPCTRMDRESGRQRIAVAVLELENDAIVIREVTPLIAPERLWNVCEPSIIKHGGRFLLTMRSQMGDFRMYHAESEDGLTWRNVGPWRWDDGEEVATENTQQHWLEFNDSLYLIYTRRSPLANGVARSRAPLFMSEVSPDSLRIIHDTEQVVFPEKGARMGNFCTTNVSEEEAWVLTGEWLQGYVEGYNENARFGFCMRDNDHIYNRIQLIGDLLLARVHGSA